MLIRAGYDISFANDWPVPMLANLSVHPSRNKDLRTAQRIMTEPDVPLYDYVDSFGNICTRLTIPEGGITISCGFLIEDPFEPDEVAPDARQVPVEALPDELLQFLQGSPSSSIVKSHDNVMPPTGTVTLVQTFPNASR